MLTTEETIMTVIDRTKGIVDRKMAQKLYEESGISFDISGNISISKEADEALNCLIQNLSNEGGVIAKIMLHNLASEEGVSFSF